MRQKHKSSHFVIFSDSLSALQAIQIQNFNPPIVIDICVDYSNLLALNGHLVWFGYQVTWAFQGNEKANRAAKAAHNEPVSIQNIPFEDLFPQIRKKVKDLWDKCKHKKLHAIQTRIGWMTWWQ